MYFETYRHNCNKILAKAIHLYLIYELQSKYYYIYFIIKNVYNNRLEPQSFLLESRHHYARVLNIFSYNIL